MVAGGRELQARGGAAEAGPPSFAALSSGPPPKNLRRFRSWPPLIEHTADDRQLLETVVSYYHETLKQTPEALHYLESRGLKSAEMVEHFRLGFSNRTLGYHLPRTRTGLPAPPSADACRSWAFFGRAGTSTSAARW